MVQAKQNDAVNRTRKRKSSVGAGALVKKDCSPEEWNRRDDGSIPLVQFSANKRIWRCYCSFLFQKDNLTEETNPSLQPL